MKIGRGSAVLPPNTLMLLGHRFFRDAGEVVRIAKGRAGRSICTSPYLSLRPLNRNKRFLTARSHPSNSYLHNQPSKHLRQIENLLPHLLQPSSRLPTSSSPRTISYSEVPLRLSCRFYLGELPSCAAASCPNL